MSRRVPLLLAAVITIWTAWRAGADDRVRSTPRVSTLMARLDLDGDGLVDRSEVARLVPPATDLDLYDRDSDGILSAHELESTMDGVDPKWYDCLSADSPRRR